MGKRKNTSGDSSSEEEVKPKPKPQVSDSSSSSDDGDGDWNAKPKKLGKKKAKIVKKREPKVKVEEEREEGECDDDDEEFDDGEDSDGFNDGYDENLMGDEADKTMLAQMTEKEREQEIFNRGEKREVLRTRYEIEKKLRNNKKKEQAKEKGGKDPFTEASLRSNERRRNMEDKNKKKDALKGLKELREKKKQKQKLRAVDVYSSSSDSDDEDAKKGRKSSSSSSSSSSDSDSDSDNDKKKRSSDRRDHAYNGAGSDDEKQEDYVITLQDLNAIKISRTKMEKWCHFPFFGQTITGCFVKIGIGAGRDGKPTYRVAQIIDVTEAAKIYTLKAPDGKTIQTNKSLKLRHGKEDRNFRIEYVSNQEFLANEFSEWVERSERDNVDLPTKSLVDQKKKDIEKALNYSYKDSDIDEILKEKFKFNKTPKNYAMKKTQLMKHREHAENMNDHDEVDRLNKEIEQLEERAKELDKARTNSIAAISYINEKNRIRNIADAEKAIVEAREEDLKSGEVDSPFNRRNCRPTLVHKFHKKDGTNPELAIKLEPLGDALNGSAKADTPEKANGDGKPLTTIPIKLEKTPSSPPPTDQNDLFSAHNFDIQIDFDMPATHMTNANTHNHTFGTGSNTASAAPMAKTANRRSLNLEEYKKKKGLI